MNLDITFKKWIIVSKDETLIAKGIPRNRHLVPISDDTDKKRIMYYDSKKKAESGFKVSGFYNDDYWCEEKGEYIKHPLKAIEVEINMKTI